MSALANPVTISGASDDLIEIEGSAPGCDEYNVEDAHFVLTGPAGGVRVRVWYDKDGVWAIAVRQIAEDVPMIPVALTGAGYSVVAVVADVDLVIQEAS